MGFKIEDDLNTERSRQRWLEWKRRIDPEHYLDPDKRAQAGFEPGCRWSREGLIDPESIWGTINCDGISPKGEICGVTTTSGLAFKIPGRAGDSPILGAGPVRRWRGRRRRIDGPWRGEPLQSYVVPDRRGDAARHASQGCGDGRPANAIKANTIEKRLLNAKGEPNFGINFYILNAKGEYAGVAMYERTMPSARRRARSRSGPTRSSREAPRTKGRVIE